MGSILRAPRSVNSSWVTASMNLRCRLGWCFTDSEGRGTVATFTLLGRGASPFCASSYRVLFLRRLSCILAFSTNSTNAGRRERSFLRYRSNSFGVMAMKFGLKFDNSSGFASAPYAPGPLRPRPARFSSKGVLEKSIAFSDFFFFVHPSVASGRSSIVPNSESTTHSVNVFEL